MFTKKAINILIVMVIVIGNFINAEDFEKEPIKLNKTKKVYLTIITKNGCAVCAEAKKKIKSLQKKHRNIVIIEKVLNKNSIEFVEYLGGKLKIPTEKLLITPNIFLGNQFIARNDISKNNIITAINSSDKSIYSQLKSNKINLEINYQNRLEDVSIGMIFFTGLLDGINPCAFATLIFFLSYLAILKQNKKQLIVVGSIFCLTVFCTYFIIGFGFFTGLKAIYKEYQIKEVIFTISGIFILILGVFNLLDVYLSKYSKKKIMLQLSDSRKSKIREIIRKNLLSYKMLIPTIVIIGFSVSLLELGCTGQVYLPIITYIIQSSKNNSTAISYLLIYNFAFIIPLIIVLILFISGIKWQKINSFFIKYMFLSKLLIGIIFIILGIFILSF